MSQNPEIGKSILANGIATNYHDVGRGAPVLLIHGSGPGVSAWANWRLTIPALVAIGLRGGAYPIPRWTAFCAPQANVKAPPGALVSSIAPGSGRSKVIRLTPTNTCRRLGVVEQSRFRAVPMAS